jgi:plastocyanin
MATTTGDRPSSITPATDEMTTTAPALAGHQTIETTAWQAAPVAKMRRPEPTFDHFLLAQLPLALSVALIFGIIAFTAVRYMPTGGTESETTATGAAPAASTGGGSNAPITAFSSEPAAQQIPVAADPSGALKWDKTTYEAQAGDVTFVVTNKSVSTHNFAVEGGNVKAQGKNFGANTTTTYTLKGLAAGEYLIVCNFPGHRDGGMVAKLIVR